MLEYTKEVNRRRKRCRQWLKKDKRTNNNLQTNDRTTTNPTKVDYGKTLHRKPTIEQQRTPRK